MTNGTAASPTTAMSNRDALIKDWKDTKAILDAATAKERELRASVIDMMTTVTDEMHSGTESIDLGYGFDLKIEHKLTYKLKDIEENPTAGIKAFSVVDAEDLIESTVESGGLLVERLVKWSPEISVSEYKKLPPAAKKIIDRVLTITPATKAIKLHKRGK